MTHSAAEALVRRRNDRATEGAALLLPVDAGSTLWRLALLLTGLLMPHAVGADVDLFQTLGGSATA